MLKSRTRIGPDGQTITVKRSWKKILIILVVLAVIGVAAAFYATGSAEKLTEYEIGGDKVASINAVICETRKVTGVSTGTSNGVRYKEYNYETVSVLQDLMAYAVYLQNNGWTVTKDYNLTTGSGEMQFGKESADSGKILVMSIAFSQGKYGIRINKLDGTLTRN